MFLIRTYSIRYRLRLASSGVTRVRIDTMMVPVTTTGVLRSFRKDRLGRSSPAPRSVTPPAGDAPRFVRATGRVVGNTSEARLASSHLAGARARRLGADGDRGFAPRLRLTPASTGLKLVILWLVTNVIVQPLEAATASGAAVMDCFGIGRLSVARCRPTALSKGDGFDVRASRHGLLALCQTAQCRHMSHNWATSQQDFEPKCSAPTSGPCRNACSTTTEQTMRYLGLDVHSEATVYCLLSADGTEFERGKVSTSAPALGQLVRRLSESEPLTVGQEVGTMCRSAE